MSIWAQIEDSRVTSIPPDGRTSVDIYATFSFSNATIPEGTNVYFLIGSGSISEALGGEENEIPTWTEAMVKSAITPIDGITLVNQEGEEGYECVAKVRDWVIRDIDGKMSVVASAKCSIQPIADLLTDHVTILAYSNYDKLGTVQRLEVQELQLTIMSGEGVFLAVTEKYDPIANEWETVEPMNVGRSGLFCKSVGGKVYAIGGFNGNFTDAVEEYDPSSDQWAQKEALPVARGFGCSAVYNSKIYIIGGYNFDPGRASSLVHRYDPSADSWEELASLPLPVSHGVAEVVGSNIYVLFGATSFENKGGKDEQPDRFNTSVYKYDIGSGTWSIEDVDTSPVATPPSGTISASASIGDTVVIVPTSLSFPQYGAATIDRGGAAEETVSYKSYDAVNGRLELDAALIVAHASGETIVSVSLPETRMAPNSVADGTDVKVMNGQSYLGLTNSVSTIFRGTISEYNTVTKDFTQTTTSPTLKRMRASSAILTVSGTDRSYTVGGSAEKSDFLDELDYFNLVSDTFVGPTGLAEMLYARHSLGAAATGGYLYAVGGGGSGHPPGWLQITVASDPASLRADGKETSGIVITALDASGDPPPDGTQFRANGLIFIQLTDEERTAALVAQATTESAPLVPPQKISILPVLFSSRDMYMDNGIAATILLERSEDTVQEVENLFQFVQAGEEVLTEDQLKKRQSEQLRNRTQTAGLIRQLYNVAIEVSVVDDFYFGQSDTDAAIVGLQGRDLSSASNGFNFNPQTAQQGLSTQVSFYSDITSIPDIEVLTEEPVDVDEIKELLDEESEKIPFGASPHFDAIVTGAQGRIVDPPAPPLRPPTNLMVTASDNDENFSQYNATEVAEQVNGVDGQGLFPVFINTFIVTDPISLAARRARTDVADLEYISSETGGNSFSVVDPSFVDFVIERIKTSAPASMGSGIILATRAIDGSLASVRYVVEGVPGNEAAIPNASTNKAEMRVYTSLDNYNFEDMGVVVPPNVTFSLAPTRATYLRYEITLTSKTFNSPILKSVSINYIKDGIQYVFTSPYTVSGQISELAGTANHRITDGTVDIGFAHGESIMFDRDYRSINQPEARERGTIMAVNRSFDTFIGTQTTRDILYTDDFLLYRSKSGPWSQEAVTRIFVGNIEALPGDFTVLPEEALVAFRKKLSPEDVVSMEIQLPNTFRVGLKITNPTLQKGKFDEFAFMYGATQDESGVRINTSPTAVNLFITPEPVVPGGPVEANYTFVDPDGDQEDKSETEINWFRDGALVPAVRNKRSFTDSDLIAGRSDLNSVQRIAKGQEWFFTVRPSDGKAFGAIAVSHSIFVSNVPPVAENVRLESTNGDVKKFTSSDSVVAKFDFVDVDEGDVSKDTQYTWFVNGAEVKTGASNSIAPSETDSAGGKLLRPNNTVFVEILPADGSDFGVPDRSDTITIEGTPPTANEVLIIPSSPSTASELKLTYTFVDVDDGQDQSTIAWYKNGARISELDNSRTVSSILTAPGQAWQAILTPNNSFASGDPVSSNTVVIQF